MARTLEEIKAEQAMLASQIAEAEGGLRNNNIASGVLSSILGAADTASFGLSDDIASLVLGEDAYRTSDRAQMDNPLAYNAGSLLGAFMPGASTSAAVGGLGKYVPSLSKASKMIDELSGLKGIIARGIGRGAAGAADAGIYAMNEGADISDAATAGGLVGGTVGTVADAIGAGIRNAGQVGKAFEDSYYGMTPTALRKAWESSGRKMIDSERVSKLTEGFDQAKKEGLLTSNINDSLENLKARLDELASKTSAGIDNTPDIVPAAGRRLKALLQDPDADKRIAVENEFNDIIQKQTSKGLMPENLRDLYNLRKSYNAGWGEGEGADRLVRDALAGDFGDTIRGSINAAANSSDPAIAKIAQDAVQADLDYGKLASLRDILQKTDPDKLGIAMSEITKIPSGATRAAFYGGMGLLGAGGAADRYGEGRVGEAAIPAMGAGLSALAFATPQGRLRLGRLLQSGENFATRFPVSGSQAVSKGYASLSNIPEQIQPSAIAGEQPTEEEFNIDEFLASIGNETPEEPKKKSDTLSYNDSGVPDDLIQRVIRAESAGNPNAVSPKGAVGLMQVMPGTWAEVTKKLGLEGLNPRDPEHNKIVGSAYLAEQLKKYGDEKLALAAYNFGPGAVDNALKRSGGGTFEDIRYLVPSETRNYVDKITG